MLTPIEPDPESPEAVRLFLLLTAIGKIELTALVPFMPRDGGRDPILFSRVLREVELKFTRDLSFPDPAVAERIEDERQAMENELYYFRRDQGADLVVERTVSFLDGLAGTGLQETEGLALTQEAAKDRITARLQRDAELWALWNTIERYRPTPIPLKQLLRNQGAATPAGKADFAGYYCLKCGFRFGTDEEAVRQLLAVHRRCWICEKYYGEPTLA